MSWQWEPTEKIHYYNNIEVISIRRSKILGDAPRIFLLHVDCVLRTLPGVLPLLPSPFANMLDLLQGRYVSYIHYHSPDRTNSSRAICSHALVGTTSNTSCNADG